MNTMTEIEIKNLILKDANEYKDIYLPTSHIYDKIINSYDKVLCKQCLRELEEEGLIKFETQRIHISITKLGKKVISIGYSIHKNQVEEESKQLIIDTKTKAKLELKTLQFSYKWRFLIILSALLSLASFIISILPYFKKS